MSDAAWAVRNIDDWTFAGVEREGRHRHDWWRHPDFSRTWLFKPARPERHRSMREDIVEKMACQIAGAIEVPAAPVVLAVQRDQLGALVEDVRMPNGGRVSGRVLLAEVVPDYAPQGDSDHRGHNVRDIQRALDRFVQPRGTRLPPDFTAFDVFAGYLIFDALIAHGDRHEGNWAVLVPPPGDTGPETLCPSYDHAASLGVDLSDTMRARRLAEGSVAAWAARGRASRFEHRSGRPWASLVDLARSAVELSSPATRTHWRERLEGFDADAVFTIVSAAPDLSDVCRSFLSQLLGINRERLLNVLR